MIHSCVFRKTLVVSLCCAIAASFVVFAAANPLWAASSDDFKMPKTIYWASRYVGGALYTVPAVISDQIAPELGVKIRLIPGVDVEMVNMMQAHRAHLASFASVCYWATMGLKEFATFASGPQPIRIIWPGTPLGPGCTGLATKVSNIKTPYDLKGKTVCRVRGAAWSDAGLRASLAFGKLTYDDVKIHEVSSTGAMYKSLVQGKADYCVGSTTAPTMYELAASPLGFQIVVFDSADKDAWARANEYVPYWVPYECVLAAGLKEGEKVWTASSPWPITNCMASQPDEFVYQICKAIHKRMDKIVAAYEPCKAMRVERAITPEATIMAPYHNGAIKYFKEIGVWTPAHEAANNKKLAQLKKLNDAWEAYCDDAQKRMKESGKKIKAIDEWPQIVHDKVGMLP